MNALSCALARSIPFALLLLGSSAMLPAAAQGVGTSEEVLPSVTAGQVKLQQVNSSYQLLGTVNPYRAVTIGCAVAGRMRELRAKRGDPVAAGDTIAELHTDVNEIELASARAELRLAEEQLAELTAGSREEDVAEAEARMAAAWAIAKRAQSQLQRIQRLIDSQAASQDEADVATADAESSDQFHTAAVIAHRRLVAGPRAEQVAQAQARVDLQYEQVRLLEDRLRKHTIIAPFDGYVTFAHTEAGAWVADGGPVVDLIELENVRVEVAVPAPQVVSLRPGQSIRVECRERPTELLVGELERIVPAADTRARTYPVLIRIENRIDEGNPVLMSGMLVQVDLPTGPVSEGLFVPTDSIVLNKFRKSVFVVDLEGEDGAGIVREIPVTLGVADEGRIEVSGDLLPGQWVITRGNERLRSGQRVEVTLSDDGDLE